MARSVARRALVLATLSIALSTSGFDARSPNSSGPRKLSFEQRVAAQEAIERVGYAHAIGPKLPFSKVFPPELLEARVRTTLLLSRMLETDWGTPVTSEMLRAEVERMARASRMPDRLRELFHALGDDPVVVEECLARSVLVERVARSFLSSSKPWPPDMPSGTLDDSVIATVLGVDRTGLAAARGESDASLVRDVPVVSDGSALPPALDRQPRTVRGAGTTRGAIDQREAGGPGSCQYDDSWDNGALDEPPDPRAQHSAVWTGSTMIVWGGSPITASGARYTPTTDTWSSIASSGAPSPRYGHSAVWTGSRMIVWGGTDGGAVLGDGGLYDPATDQWTPIPATGNPAARSGHSAVWTGSRMIVWGGVGSSSVLFSGASFDPLTGQWTPIAGAGAPAARTGHTAVWSGTRMIVWGGTNGPAYLASGGRYDPSTNSWTPTAILPTGRAWHTAVWTGTTMVVWGGFDGAVTLETGARYDLDTNTWTPTNDESDFTPIGRRNHAAVWSGTRMIVYGGIDYTGALQPLGGLYDPSADDWTTVQTTGAPTPRQLLSAVWTGNRLVVWGGRSATGSIRTGGRFDPFTSIWTPVSTGSGPSARARHSAVWTGSRWIVWGGNDGTSRLGSGGRYDPATDSWSAVTLTSAPEARDDHSAVWTGSRMVIWGGRNASANLIGGGDRYDPVADQWSPVTGIGAPAARAEHSAVWTGTRMLVWGGEDTTGVLAQGAGYDPLANSWTPLPAAAQPSPRSGHVAVWTGSRMVVWGGFDGASFLATGARYDAATDAWTATSTLSAPSGRSGAASAWTGSHVFVWGGDDGSGAADSGGLYDPFFDSWTSTSQAGAPSARRLHSAVATGRFVFVWGGNGVAGRDGARYDPTLDEWVPFDAAEAPSGRAGHSALWTGTRMLVWGGTVGVPVATGGVYDAGEPIGDLDADGICGPADNCPSAANPSQGDIDSDGLGDACEPYRVDFATPASAVAAGYVKDDGSVYTNVRGYGWDAAVASRERVTAAPLELDTFVFSQPERKWTFEIPDADYDFTVSIGDASATQGPQRVVVQGTTALNGVTTSAGQFVQTSIPVSVRGGRLDVRIGGAAGNTALNLIRAARADLQPALLRAVNFQPVGAATPVGYEADNGAVFDPGRGYGWNVLVQTRERGTALPQILDTFAFTSPVRTWEIAVPNATYDVRLAVGDAQFGQGPQRVVVEGTTVVNNESTAAGVFLERSATVNVSDGRLTVVLGGTAANSMLNYVSLSAHGP